METPFVFVVDDEPGIALLCKRLLSRSGYMVETETDPRKAINYLKENKIDLLLVDIRMPEVDGFEVIQHAQRLQPDAAVLIMTGHGTVETAIRALRQGVDGLLLKPFGKGSDLVDAVKLALVDCQQKRDAARTQALRPLFSVTESLLSETRREPLLDLIISAICTHLRCSHAACFQQNTETKEFSLLASRGREVPKKFYDLISSVDESATPLMINASGPGQTTLRSILTDLRLGAAILTPIQRPNLRMVVYAARNLNEPHFRESDLELFQILARQAAAALENARLYAEQLDYVRKVEDSQKALLQAEKMAAAGRLSASIAHEVNNPLQAVQNCLHLAGREDLPAEKRQEYFNLARTELERLTITVRRMLDFYRPGATSLETVDLVEMLQYILNLMSKQLSEANVKVVVDFFGKISPIQAVGSQIQQVFINLILNAVDAMPEGGVLKIIARQLKGGVELLFQDQGKGIPEEKQSNIFEPFFSTKDGGTGLGLTVSYNIITAHGGTLEYLSERVPGACFRIFLPIGGEQ
ncbi:MAG: response regulator [Anaerolineales bacterium]|jgi:signal transduction histidine kinase/DNA-binding response OmpR family regulator|uniref:hybrid sensor histidine kinase/response regulator n=1 Tax=Candidatus Villigracilis affinis TaxID=3140682 RepID=UPI002A1D2C51|nr:response regulator [Anaerolineales bacterium]MBL0348625.1 response regulator [Anaerolineales bacterium]